ncbi:hypothetical protein BKA69DRAFT_1041563 [Paraphysoderma sedebokerense]|nr:hypothetical protein BKA69DRAFT_1041563 [Paraphysoderma sedebokerense]
MTIDEMNGSTVATPRSGRRGDNATPRSARKIEDKTAEYASITANTANKVTHKIADISTDITYRTKSMTESYIATPMRNALGYIRRVFDQYPLLRSFTYVFSFFSLVPVSIFLMFAIGTALSTLFVAVSSLAVVEGAFLLPALGILSLFLMGAAGVTMTLFGGFILAWFSIASLKVVSTKMNQLLGGTAATMEKDMEAVEHGVRRGLETAGR